MKLYHGSLFRSLHLSSHWNHRGGAPDQETLQNARHLFRALDHFCIQPQANQTDTAGYHKGIVVFELFAVHDVILDNPFIQTFIPYHIFQALNEGWISVRTEQNSNKLGILLHISKETDKEMIEPLPPGCPNCC